MAPLRDSRGRFVGGGGSKRPAAGSPSTPGNAGGVFGLAHIERQLQQLRDVVGPKVLHAGLKAALKPLAKEMRKAVSASGASTELKRSARKAVGARFTKDKRKKKGDQQAKVGLGVGKRSKKPQREAGRKGVGLSKENIHWATLGTANRRLKKGSQRGPKAGHPTGRMPPVLEHVTDQALAVGAPAAVDAAKQKMKAVLLKGFSKKG